MQDYKVEGLTRDKSIFFKGLYADFVSNAFNNYRFELPPLPFDEFVDAVEQGILKCLVLYENDFPTAFLVYTTTISESIELNLIHCLGDEDLVGKRRSLMGAFLEDTDEQRNYSAVCYPMMGSQGDFTGDIAHFGFDFMGLVVLRYIFGNEQSNLIYDNLDLSQVGYHIKLAPWNESYRKEAVKIIHNNFKDTSDALFDTRFKTMQGTEDIVYKVLDSVYGEFLPEATTVLLHMDKPVGIVFANLTTDKIANIPLVAINRDFRGKGYSVHMLNRTLGVVRNYVNNGVRNLNEINVTTETDNYGALKMYRATGFKEDYSYTQAYLSPGK